MLAQRLRAAGLPVDVFEPEPGALPPSRQLPLPTAFAGRPQLVARSAGTGGGPSLLLCGHVDVVSAEPLERWTSASFQPQVRDGRLFGRGACDIEEHVDADELVRAAQLIALATMRFCGVAD